MCGSCISLYVATHLMEIPKQLDLLKELFKRDKFILCILDACRFDFFDRVWRDYPWLTSRATYYARVWSVGSHTLDFLEIVREYLPTNLVYISANPHTALVKLPCVVDQVWDWGWCEELKTVHPRTIVLAVIRWLLRGYRRLIVHFVQPHEPFIGRTKLIRGNLWQTRYFIKTGKIGIPDGMLDVDPDLLKRGYEDNLRLVIEAGVHGVLRLASRYGIGTVVITSDHGEVLDEYTPQPPFYDRHPRGLAWRILREVPWLEVQTISRA